MHAFEEKYRLWDQFLHEWPVERLETMTLEQYSQVGFKSSFTYWMESRLDRLGSIWGGSAFKFGVYARRATDTKESGKTFAYSQAHGWYASLGSSADEAFVTVRSWICDIVRYAQSGDLEAIEEHAGLGEVFKWKIAFHYQNRARPSIVNVFKRAALAVFVGSGTLNQAMAPLQAEAMQMLGEGQGILEFGEQVWEAWSKRNLRIWKVSHGDKDFSKNERARYLDANLVVVHQDTGLQQGKNFAKAPIGTVFYLCHGNSPQLIGQLISDPGASSKGPGWLERSYRVLVPARRNDPYSDNQKKWTPRGVSAFWRVKPDDLALCEATLLKPYFNSTLAELAAIAGEPLAVTLADKEAAAIMSDEAVLRRFDGSPAFQTIRAAWDDTQIRLFCRLARVVNGAGLDWWHTSDPNKLAFGRKDPGSDRALGVLGTLRYGHQLKMRLFRALAALGAARHEVTFNVLTLLGDALDGDLDELEEVFAPEAGRNGMWPDELRDDFGADAASTAAGAAMQAERPRPVNRIFYGPPGTGKTHALLKLLARDFGEEPRVAEDGSAPPSRFRFVTFHQSYSYEDFVEGLRPVLVCDSAAPVQSTEDLDSDENAGAVRYHIRKGVFRELCDQARRDPDRRYAIVIDEINRGNVSRIFGELITLIEIDKRAGRDKPVEVTLPYSGDRFSVPQNVDIFGTMNTADRSLALIDTALRRRFEFIPVMPDTRDEEGAPLHGLRFTVGDSVIDVPRMLSAMNQRIEALYDRDHCIGHAFFTPLRQVADPDDRFVALGQIFRNQLIPLLEEYFFDDWKKIRLILADNQKDADACFIEQCGGDEEEGERLFGRDYGLERLATRGRFVIREKAFSTPAAYVGIYATLS